MRHTGSAALIDEWLAEGRTVIIDGGMGTELEAQGAAMDYAAWSGLVNVHDPALVQRVHEDYVRAGADVVITNTFMSGSGPMARAGEPGLFDTANRNAVRSARSAAAAAQGRPVIIAGSVSVTVTGEPETGDAVGAQRHRRLRDGYQRQMEVLVDEGVDLIVLEMAQDAEHAEPALEAATAVPVPTWLGICVHNDWSRRTAGGHAQITDDHRAVLALAVDDTVAAVCVMHTDIGDVMPALKLVRDTWGGPVGVYPHHGAWVRPNWRFLELPAARFVELARRWREAGAGMIGGCCGTGPPHIAALRDDLAGAAPPPTTP